MSLLILIALTSAMVCFLLAAFRVSTKVELLALGLALWLLSALCTRYAGALS
jgi:hypothetical protein